mmetsp:Transcript_4769/g.11374  ORF Transcript_4769/g.11374 Transcript_4769/m.11374 type:complete len:294 (-) Transcript_4769:339-1220(-)
MLLRHLLLELLGECIGGHCQVISCRRHFVVVVVVIDIPTLLAVHVVIHRVRLLMPLLPQSVLTTLQNALAARRLALLVLNGFVLGLGHFRLHHKPAEPRLPPKRSGRCRLWLLAFLSLWSSLKPPPHRIFTRSPPVPVDSTHLKRFTVSRALHPEEALLLLAVIQHLVPQHLAIELHLAFFDLGRKLLDKCRLDQLQPSNLVINLRDSTGWYPALKLRHIVKGMVARLYDALLLVDFALENIGGRPRHESLEFDVQPVKLLVDLGDPAARIHLRLGRRHAHLGQRRVYLDVQA